MLTTNLKFRTVRNMVLPSRAGVFSTSARATVSLQATTQARAERDREASPATVRGFALAIACRPRLRHLPRMRIALTLIALAVASPAAAQSATTLAYNDLEKCVQAKAADYAPLDDSLRDIATASIGACAAERDAVRDAYRKHYAALGASEAIATTQAAGMVDSLVADIARTAMATVAEARLQADRR